MPASSLAAQKKTATQASTPPTPPGFSNSAKSNEDKTNGTLAERTKREITRRIAALNKIKARVITIKKLNATEKTALTTEIDKIVADLNQLNSNLTGATDAAIKETASSLKNSYNVYAFFVPKIHLLTTADQSLQAADLLIELQTKLATKVAEQKTAGKDVTALETSLATMKKDAEAAKTKVETIIANVTALSATGFPANKTDLKANRQSLREVRLNLVNAKTEGKKIVDGLKALETAATTTTTTDE